MKTLSIAKKDLTTTFETIVLAMVKVPNGKLPKSSWAKAVDLDVTETGRLIFNKRSVNHIVTQGIKMKVVITTGFIDIEFEGDIGLAANKLGLEKDSLEKLLSVSKTAEAEVEEMETSKEVEVVAVVEPVVKMIKVVETSNEDVINEMISVTAQLHWDSRTTWEIREDETFETVVEKLLGYDVANIDKLKICVDVYDGIHTTISFCHGGKQGVVVISPTKYTAFLPIEVSGPIIAAMSSNGFIIDEPSAERLATSLKEVEAAPVVEEQPEPVLEERGYKSLSAEKTRAIMEKAGKKRTTGLGRFMRRNMGRIFG